MGHNTVRQGQILNLRQTGKVTIRNYNNNYNKVGSDISTRICNKPVNQQGIYRQRNTEQVLTIGKHANGRMGAEPGECYQEIVF